MMERRKARITVLKRMANMKTRELYACGFDADNPDHARPCRQFTDGQEFVADSSAPDGFCHWAWADIHKDLVMIQCGGNPGYIGPENTMISCCCDGFNPVVFKIERLAEPC